MAEGETVPDDEAIPWEKAVKGPYNSLNIRKGYDQAFPDGSVNEDGSINSEGVRSSTVVFMTNNGTRIMRNLSLARKVHRETGVVFNEKGFPIFDKYTLFECYIPENVISTNNHNKITRAATKILLERIIVDTELRNKFSEKQLQQIRELNTSFR